MSLGPEARAGDQGAARMRAAQPRDMASVAFDAPCTQWEPAP